MADESDLFTFLRQRGIPEETIDYLERENIDKSAIRSLNEEQIKEIFPKFGDRIAITDFCKNRQTSKKWSLIEKLHQKIELKGNHNKTQTSLYPKNAKKNSRIIELGWLNWYNGKFTQVRTRQGGGTRQKHMEKNSSMDDVRRRAEEIFFVKGHSTKGPLSDFKTKLLDFRHKEVDSNWTIDEVYTMTGLSRVRFYLATEKISLEDTEIKYEKKKTKKFKKMVSYNSDSNFEEPKTSSNKQSRYDLSSSSEFGESFSSLQPTNILDSLVEENPTESYLFAFLDTGGPTPDQDHLDTDTSLFENDMELAIKNSLHTNEANCENTTAEVSLEGILRALNGKINTENISQFNIYREDIFNCCIRALRRKKFAMFNKISVKFSDLEGTSEGAVDQGGPTREMFRLVIDKIKSSRMFFGQEKKNITLDGEALQNQEYFEAGRLIVLSLIHGGPGPHFFSKSLFQLLVKGFSPEYVTHNNIEYEIREKLLKVNLFTDFRTLQQYVEEEPVFSIAGWPILTKIEEKNAMIADMVKFYAYDRIRPALKQLKNGLKEGNLLDIMKENSDLFENIMCGEKVPITANTLEELYTVIYSENGSSSRRLENRSITFWRELLLSCEDGECDISLEDILVFSTGADCVPPLGFETKPTITFQKDTLYPTANTCGLELRLPIVHQKFEDFKSHVTFGIANCKDFAFA